MKALLVCSQVLCLFTLLRRRDYPALTVYLLLAIPATLAFQAESAWLYAWYPLLVWPVASLRLVAGLEVVERQTAGFAYAFWLLSSVVLLALAFAGVGWVRSDQIGQLAGLVEWRRLIQIVTGFVFLVLELFWFLHGGVRFRRLDCVALAFGLIAWNHAAVSLAAGVHHFTPATWVWVQAWSWGLDAVGYLGIIAAVRGLARSARRRFVVPSVRGAARDWLSSTHR